MVNDIDAVCAAKGSGFSPGTDGEDPPLKTVLPVAVVGGEIITSQFVYGDVWDFVAELFLGRQDIDTVPSLCQV